MLPGLSFYKEEEKEVEVEEEIVPYTPIPVFQFYTNEVYLEFKLLLEGRKIENVWNTNYRCPLVDNREMRGAWVRDRPIRYTGTLKNYISKWRTSMIEVRLAAKKKAKISGIET